MRSIEGVLSQDIETALAGGKVGSSSAFPVSTYRSLVEHVANLAYLNKDHLLFYRGQASDYTNRAGASSFYPSIYRGDYVPKREIRYRFDVLKQGERLLADAFKARRISGWKDVQRKKYIRWSILQHYEVCGTPLLDFSHSLRVACSFASLGETSGDKYLYVFGLPYFTNRISSNSEHDLVNIRLLSICPPTALRPYFQDGYLVGTEDILDEYESKTELDFNNRLIAKFSFRNTKRFWGSHFSPIPEDALYPQSDEVAQLCAEIREEELRGLESGTFGDFISVWAQLEQHLLEITENRRKGSSVLSALRALERDGELSKEDSSQIHRVRKFRNTLVHNPDDVKMQRIGKRIDEVESLLLRLRR